MIKFTINMSDADLAKLIAGTVYDEDWCERISQDLKRPRYWKIGRKNNLWLEFKQMFLSPGYFELRFRYSWTKAMPNHDKVIQALTDNGATIIKNEPVLVPSTAS